MSQLQVSGEAKIRDIQGPVVANSGVITALDGAASQYVRGDGTLADFPTSSGGGSSVSYYLNSSVSQGTIMGISFRELSKEPIIGTGTDITISADGYVASYITDVNDPDVLEVPGGNFNCEFYFSVNNNTGNPSTFAELYKYNGTNFTLLGTSVGVPEYINQGTIIAPYYFAIPVPTSSLALTDRLAIRIYVNVDGRTVTLHTENSHLCQVVTTLSKGMVSLNNLTDQSQFLTTGTSGTNFAIVSSGDTHTFNLPVASATNTGKLSNTDWSTFNNKQNALTNPITGLGASGNVAYFDSASSITSENSFNYDASTNRLGVNTTVPNATIGANAALDSGYSLLLKNDNANYNGIGFATDSTYGNLIATEKLGTALTRNLTLLNQSGYVSLTEAGNFGVNILSPNTGLDIYNGTSAYLWLHTATSGTSGTDGVRLALFNTNGANLRNFEGSFSITAEGDFSVITLGAENFKINSADGSIYQSKVANAMLKTVSGVLTAAVAGTDYLAPSAISGTTNTVAKFASSSTIGNSNITDTGSLITLGSTTNISSGNFGVGTSSPAVAGVGIDIYSATSAGLRFHTATSGTTVSDGAGINFSAANNLGITNYEAGAIDIVTNGNSGVYINQLGYVGINGATPSSELTVNGNAAISGLTTGQIVFPTTGGLLIGSSSLFWDNTNGRLAVGTNNTSTGRKLTIYSASADTHLAILGAAPSVRFADNFTATYSTLFGMATASNNYVTGAVAGDFVITYNSSNNLIFGNSNTSLEKMRINSSGNLLINTTNDNGANLNVNGVIYGTRARLNNSYDNSSVSLNVGGQTYMDSRTSRLYQTYNLSSMSNYMHIYDPYSSVNANGGFSIGASSSITTLPSTSIIHFDGVNNRVGIGTTAPSAALSVVGAATFTGALSGTSATFSGDVTLSGASGTRTLIIRNNTSGDAVLVLEAAGSDGGGITYKRSTSELILGNSGATSALKIANTGAATFSSSVTATGVSYISGNSNTGPIPYLQFTDNYGSAGRNWALINGYDNYGTLSFKVSTTIGGNPYSGTSVLSMTQAGNVGIGTSSPSNLLHAYSALPRIIADTSSRFAVFNLYAAGSEKGAFYLDNTNKQVITEANGDNTYSLVFNAGGIERMRITSGGKLFVQSTATIFANSANRINGVVNSGGEGALEVSNSGTTDGSPALSCYKANATTNSDARFIQFYASNGVTAMGGIVGNGVSNVQFASISDIREKENIKTIKDSLQKILSLNVVEFDWIKTKEHVNAGFVAQQVETIFPEYVVANMSNNGEEERKGLTGGLSSGIIAHLVKAIQEQQAQIEELKALINK